MTRTQRRRKGLWDTSTKLKVCPRYTVRHSSVKRLDDESSELKIRAIMLWSAMGTS